MKARTILLAVIVLAAPAVPAAGQANLTNPAVSGEAAAKTNAVYPEPSNAPSPLGTANQGAGVNTGFGATSEGALSTSAPAVQAGSASTTAADSASGKPTTESGSIAAASAPSPAASPSPTPVASPTPAPAIDVSGTDPGVPDEAKPGAGALGTGPGAER